MLSYDWIVLITLGLDRWQPERRPLAPHEVEREAFEQRHQAQKKAGASTGRWRRLLTMRPRALRRVRPRRQASRV